MTALSYESVPCNLCGADDPIVLLPAREADSDSRDYAASGDSPLHDRLVRCKRCDLVYVSPRPKRQTIEDGYERVDNTTYVQQGAGRLQTFAQALRWLEACGVKKGKVLDIGAAGGFFVKAAADAGWEATGLEISRHLCDYGRTTLGATMVQGTIDRASFPERSFDLISFWDVLEHVSDPADALVQARRWLKPGGTLLINYPDYSSIWAHLLGRKWWFLIDVHIYYFTPATLSKLLEKCGFKPGRRRMHFQTLPLGYLAERIQGIFPLVGRPLDSVIRRLGLRRIPFTYYASQQTMLAQPIHGQK